MVRPCCSQYYRFDKVSLFQSMTQIQEFTLAFVPKVVAVGAALVASGNWMLQTLINFTQDLFAMIPGLLA